MMNFEVGMSTKTLREATEADFARVAELISATQPEPVTEANVQEWERRVLAEQIRRRMVAVDGTGQIAGYSVVLHTHSMGEGRFYLWVTVDPGWRRCGIGAQLYDNALDLAISHGAVLLESEVREDAAAGVHFARERGFAVNRHLFESVIDLAALDESRFAGLVERVQAGGIRFLSLADVDMDPGYFRQLYEVNYRAVLDDPASSGNWVSFKEFEGTLRGASWFDPQGQIMALDATTGAVIGLAAVGYFANTNRASNMITGVDRAYRGRKIAQALKLLTIRYAKEKGASHIVTDNDSQNAPMLAINRKLGYVPRPGIFRLLRPV
jgi:ribosomal protein S18 acetylase RimI-like enzyme